MIRRALQWFRSLFRPKWHHITCRYDGSTDTGNVQVYLNGELLPTRGKARSISFWVR